jgi:hypothetical protein
MSARDELQSLIDRYDPKGNRSATAISGTICTFMLCLLLLGGGTTGPAGLRITLPQSAKYTPGWGTRPGCITSQGRPSIWIFGYSASEAEVVADLQKKAASDGTIPDVLGKKAFAVAGMKGERLIINDGVGLSTYYLLNIDKPRVLVTVLHSSHILSADEQTYFKTIVKSIALGNSADPVKGISITFLIGGLVFPRLLMLGLWWLSSLPVHNIPWLGSAVSLVVTPRLLIAAYAYQNGQFAWCWIYLFCQIWITTRPARAVLDFTLNNFLSVKA